MSDKLFNALEICLRAIERGETMEAALARFPALAGKLRPILEASLRARALSVSAVPSDVQRRGRGRLLQRAAELREAKRAPRRTWIFAFRPVVVTLILAIFLLTGTGFVRASSASLPGDNLYPVKRTWEDVRLVFAPSEQKRENLELTFENERLEEITELLAEGRSETVSFVGYVTAQNDGRWTVAGVPVVVSHLTLVADQPITIGMAVTVTGRTDAQGFLAAESIRVVAPGTVIPPLENADNDNDNDPHNYEENISGNNTPAPTSNLQGKIEFINGNIWVVNGRPVNVGGVDIIGVPAPGADVIVEGYDDTNGIFIATRVTFVNGADNGNGSSVNDNGNDNNGNDDNGNDNNGNDDNGNNDNGNSNDNENGDNDNHNDNESNSND